MIDFEADAAETALPSEPQIQGLVELVSKMQSLETLAGELEAALKKTTEELRHYAERLIPDRMQELQLKSIELADGSLLEIKDEVYASIPKAAQNEAFAWLEHNGYGDLVKQQVSVALRVGDDCFTPLLSWLQTHQVPADVKASVHAGSLKAFAKERLREGITLPPELFTVFDYRKATVKRPR